MGGPFQPPIRAPGHGRGSRLIALTSFYSPARRKSCGFFVFNAKAPGKTFRIFASWC
jgi:hypothetical protein